MQSDSQKTVKLLNQGTYGCIYHPGINCKGKKENIRYVSKIQKNEKTIANELKIGEKIRKIKGYTRLFAPILKDCNVEIDKSYISEIKKCKPLKIQSDADLANEYLITKLRFVGDMNLKDYLIGRNNDSTISSLMDSSSKLSKKIQKKPTGQKLKQIKISHKFILNSVKKLNAAGIIHYDIKYNNIMFDIKSNNPVIIDFGISLDTSKLTAIAASSSSEKDELKKMFYAYDTYPYWCIDVCTMNYIFQKNVQMQQISQLELDSIWKVFVYGSGSQATQSSGISTEYPVTNATGKIQNDIFSTVFFNNAELISEMKTKWMEYMTPFIGKQWKSYYEYIISEKLYLTWDAYAVEVVFMFILDEWIRRNPSISKEIKPSIDKYKMRFQQIIFCRPDERKSLEMFQ